MALDLNQPYGIVNGNVGRARYVQNGVYYDVNGVQLSAAPATSPFDTPELAEHARMHERMGSAFASGDKARTPYVLFANHTQSQKNDADAIETELRAFTIHGGTLGKNDMLKITHVWTFPNSATTKAVKMYIGNTLFASYGITGTDKHQGVEYFRNRGSQISNFAVNDQIPYGPRAGGILATAVDTTVDQVLSIRTRWGTAGTGTNIITLESVLVEVIPGA